MLTSLAAADINNCQNLYVGQIVVEKGFGSLSHVQFLNAPGGSGSRWVVFRTWSADEKKSALAVLTAAKLAQHRVNITTTDGCGITTDTGVIEAVNVGLANH
jgi:hypothetical protein